MSAQTQKKLLACALVGLLASLYFATLARDGYLEDSGEFVSAAYFLGIAHPSGYPLFVLLGKLFSFLPAGSIAWRINLMTAIFAIAGTLMLFVSLLELAKVAGEENRRMSILAFLLALIFGVSRDFWSQGLVAEVYTLNIFLLTVFLFYYLKWWRLGNEKILFFLAFWSGLGLTNHLLFGFMVPFFWSAIVWRSPKLPWKRVGIFILFFILGLVPYFYLPLRASTNPQINFGQIHGWYDSLRHILRISYHDLGLSGVGRGTYVFSFLSGLAFNVSMLVALMALAGIFTLIRKKRIDLLLVFLGSFFSCSLVVIFLRNLNFSLAGEFVYRVYYFPAYVFAILLAFIFLSFLNQFTQQISIIALTVIAITLAVQNLPLVSLRNNQVSAYYERELESLPPRAVLLLVDEGFNDDSEIFSLFYLQKVRNIRPDVKIIDSANIFVNFPKRSGETKNRTLAELRREYLEYALRQYGQTNPILTTFPVEKYSESYVSLPTAWAFAVLPKNARRNVLPSPLPAHPFSPREKWDLAYQDFLAAAYYKEAAYHVSRGETKPATSSIIRAIALDGEPDSEDYQAFVAYRASLPKTLTNSAN